MFDKSHKENIAPLTQENVSPEDTFLFERKHKRKQTEKRQKNANSSALLIGAFIHSEKK